MTTLEANSRAATSARRSPRGGTLALVGHQLRYELLMFWRNRQSRFFTMALPVIFLLIFASIWHGDTVTVAGGTIDESVYYVPGIITLGIVSAAFNNLVISVTASRESGIFKRRRATPIPAAVLIAARALSAMVVALVMTVILLLIGWAAYGANVSAGTAPGLVVAVLVGAAAFCCLGFAVASVITNADSAQPLTQAIILPLYFIHTAVHHAGLADRHRGVLPGPPPRGVTADCLQPPLNRRWHRMVPSRHRRHLGSSRPAGGLASIQLATEKSSLTRHGGWLLWRTLPP
jgi:ABC-2 type transport system permease protein